MTNAQRPLAQRALVQRPLPNPVMGVVPTGVSIPSEAGTYALVLDLPAPIVLRVRSLGVLTLPPGEYIYVGSACGPGGLRARVGRHLRGTGRPHWHIDYLRRHATIRAVIYAVTDQRLECAWARTLSHLPGAQTPIRGFGSSDCRSGCTAHLIALPAGVNLQGVQTILSKTSVSFS